MPGSEMLEFTELGINLHQPLTPMDRNHSPLTNYQNLKTSEMVYVFRQSVEPGLLEQLERVQPLFPPSFVSSTATATSQPQGAQSFSLQAGVFWCWVFFFFVQGGVCVVFDVFVSLFLKGGQMFFGFVCTFLSYSVILLSWWQVKWVDVVVELPFLFFLNFYWYHWVTAMQDQKSQRWFSLRSGSCSLSHRALLLP